ncbi:MAG: GtrA family protein [Bacteroidota bacterium]|nr:GtrA family protein [Bacteroidota bacterium]
MIEFLFKLIRFGLVGATGLVVDFGLTFFFKEKAKINKYLANAIGFSVAASTNFYINKIWTFEDKSNLIVSQFFMFFFIALVGLGINQAILYVLHHHFKHNFYISKLGATVIVFLWNFIMNYWLTFNQAF